MSEEAESHDEEAARLGCAGFATGIGCAAIIVIALIIGFLAIGVAMRDYQG